MMHLRIGIASALIAVFLAVLVPVLVVRADHAECPPLYQQYGICDRWERTQHVGQTPTPTPTPTPGPSPTPTPTPTPPPGDCQYKPPAASEAVNQAICDIAREYNLPRWWLYAIVHRESSFDPNFVNPNM